MKPNSELVAPVPPVDAVTLEVIRHGIVSSSAHIDADTARTALKL